MNTPWYRPTRVNHVVKGAEFGWRNGSGKWPDYYADSLPAAVNIGPGSPTGVTFGYGAKFPAKYQDAFYICDWSYGKLYAVHLDENGASYRGSFEEFVTGAPLPLTDILVHPQDGALYFAVGGRRTQSALYRVTYSGKDPVTPSTSPSDPEAEKARELRTSLEFFQRPGAPQVGINLAWKNLNNRDRFLRSAARHCPGTPAHLQVALPPQPRIRFPAPIGRLPRSGTGRLPRPPGIGPHQSANPDLFNTPEHSNPEIRPRAPIGNAACLFPGMYSTWGTR
ncbi:MAG: hypothetical protein LR011_00765 [Verrucomicrobia bacterium]|nr:hypothetical protein [Verrucomicrobiota bacterium]